MSYEIVKKIRIDEESKKVFITSDSNNVFPKYFKEWECKCLSEIYQEKGLEAMEVAILKAYEEGNFQTSHETKYTRALRALRQMPVYQKSFSWRISEYGKDCPIQANRNSEEFNQLLTYALSIKPESGKFIVTMERVKGTIVYLHKVTKTRVRFAYDKAEAKIFKYSEDIESLKNCFENSRDWKIETL